MLKNNIYLNIYRLETTEEFKNKTLEFPLPYSEKEERFTHPDLCFDISYFNDNRRFDKNYQDISAVIYSNDIISDDNIKHKESSILYSGFKVFLNTTGEYKIKPDIQKLFIRGQWYEMVDIYGMSLNPNT